MWHCESGGYGGKIDKDDADWDIKVDNPSTEDGKCPHFETEVRVMLSERAYAQTASLCSKYQELEWMAGLLGKIEDSEDKDKKRLINITVDRLILFEQEVTGSTVELTKKGNEDMSRVRTIGWIHSHNTMGVFLSSVDMATAGFSTISICVNNKLEFFAKYTLKLPCETYAYIQAEVLTKPKRDEKILKLADKLISEKKSIVISYNNDIPEYGGRYHYSITVCHVCDEVISNKMVDIVYGKPVCEKCKNQYYYYLENQGRSSHVATKLCPVCGLEECMCESIERAVKASS